MAHITVPENVPGIRSLALFRPETAKYLYELAHVLLRGSSPLSPGEREIIAAFVSQRNNCGFCMNSHAAAARCLLQDNASDMDDVLADYGKARISAKLKALLNIAGKVQISGKEVLEKDITAARACGANDLDIHDTVLIAATFSMFNRYVDGLATATPEDPGDYLEMGRRLAENGYAVPTSPS